MVARGPGDVGCAHCTKLGADRTCPVCKLQVCERCSQDWTTCDQPAGRSLRLGASARVRDIDPLARRALVSHWRQPLRVLDLRGLQWVAGTDLPRSLYSLSRHIPPRLTAAGALVHPEVTYVSGEYIVSRVRWRAEPQHGGTLISTEAPVNATSVSDTGDRFAFVTDSQHLVVMTDRGGLDIDVHTYEPLPRSVIQAYAIDGSRDLVASATWAQLALHRIAGATLERIDVTKTEHEGNIAWVGLAGPYVVAVITAYNTQTQVEVRKLTETLTFGPVFRTYAWRTVTATALSSDGRYLAIAYGDVLEVHDIDKGTTAKLRGHTDVINAVRFGADDFVLVSADCDNRVIIRPRTETGYDVPLIDVEVH